QADSPVCPPRLPAPAPARFLLGAANSGRDNRALLAGQPNARPRPGRHAPGRSCPGPARGPGTSCGSDTPPRPPPAAGPGPPPPASVSGSFVASPCLLGEPGFELFGSARLQAPQQGQLRPGPLVVPAAKPAEDELPARLGAERVDRQGRL